MRNPFKREPDPFAAGRYSEIFRTTRKREKKHMRHWWQWALLGLFVAITAFAGYGTWKYYQIQNEIYDPVDDVTEEEEGQPFNALLIGSDSRGDLSEEEQLELGAAAVGGERADTLILAHVDPADDTVIMVQFPRDLWVPIDGGSENKINSALETGVGVLVRTVEDLTGLQIHRYVKVNIAGFRDVVDAIGGVDICITEPIPFDEQTGIEISEDELGMVHFDGDRALRFVRSRNFATGDFERIKNQQKFLAAAVNKLTSLKTIWRPDRIIRLLDVAGENVRASMKIPQLRDLLERFRNFDPDHYEAYTAPNFGTSQVDGLSVVLPDMRTMDVLFDAIGDNQSPADATGAPMISPSAISLGVYNGTFEEGVAAEAAAELETALTTSLGALDVAEVANATRFNYRDHVIRYDPNEPEAEEKAQLVAAAVPSAQLRAARLTTDVDVELIIGSKPFRAKKVVQIPQITLPEPGAPPPECH